VLQKSGAAQSGRAAQLFKKNFEQLKRRYLRYNGTQYIVL